MGSSGSRRLFLERHQQVPVEQSPNIAEVSCRPQTPVRRAFELLLQRGAAEAQPAAQALCHLLAVPQCPVLPFALPDFP